MYSKYHRWVPYRATCRLPRYDSYEKVYLRHFIKHWWRTMEFWKQARSSYFSYRFPCHKQIVTLQVSQCVTCNLQSNYCNEKFRNAPKRVEFIFDAVKIAENFPIMNKTSHINTFRNTKELGS